MFREIIGKWWMFSNASGAEMIHLSFKVIKLPVPRQFLSSSPVLQSSWPSHNHLREMQRLLWHWNWSSSQCVSQSFWKCTKQGGIYYGVVSNFGLYHFYYFQPCQLLSVITRETVSTEFGSFGNQNIHCLHDLLMKP